MSVKDINVADLKKLLQDRDKVEIIDVRQKEEYDIVRIKGSKLIPMEELPERLDEIDWNKNVVFVCRSGSRSKMMAYIVGAGKEIKNLSYGIYECYMDKDCPDLDILSDEVEVYFNQ